MMNEYFVNPYNFVSLGEECDKKKRETVGDLTGKITCKLTTLTPMFIPNEKDSTNFYCYPTEDAGDLFRPVIPGSEIRGAIRSVFEAAFNGCLSQVNDKRFHRRSMDVKKPGLLYRENGEWVLEESERIMLNTSFPEEYKRKKHGKYINKSEIETGKEIYIKRSNQKYKNIRYTPYVVSDYCFKEKEGYTKGIVYIGEPFRNSKRKHHESVFIEKNRSKRWRIRENQIDSLENVIDLYHENHKGEGGKPYENYIQTVKGARKNRKVPVYYSKIDGENIAHLAPAIFSQEVFERKLESILDEHGGYTPCSCKNDICPACHLFGFVKNKEAQASRIRFGDAISNNKIEQSDIKRLPALGAPKPGAVEFYAKKMKPGTYWTYDYVKNGKKRAKLSTGDLEIRGRKFYWHHESKLEEPEEENDSEMIVKVRPIKKGNSFTFNLYFERLTKKELAQLCNVLDINDSGEYAHKIGRAKPLGFGSVQIKIGAIQTRSIDRKTGQYFFKNEARKKYFDNQIPQNSELLEILKFKPVLHGKPVSYPKVKGKGNHEKSNEIASHQWFNNNNCNKKKFIKFLPTIGEETSNNDTSVKHKWLTVYYKNKRNNSPGDSDGRFRRR